MSDPVKSLPENAGEHGDALRRDENPLHDVEFERRLARRKRAGTIFAVGMLLFAMTFILNLISQRVLAKYRQAYQ